MNPNEFAPQKQQQHALYEALNNLTDESFSGSFTFTQYDKYVMSEDGYVFWVKNGSKLKIKGALHVGTEQTQELDDTIAMNSIILDSEKLISEFNTITPNTMWIGDIPLPDGQTIKVAFNRRGPFFENAGVYHYAGFAVFPPFGPQIVESSTDLPTGPIVSNSLPIWMNLPNALQNLPGAVNQSTKVYPSFLVPENIAPPYIVAHIEPTLTVPLQQFPNYSWTFTAGSTSLVQMTSDQLAKDVVKLIFYGFTNQEVLQYQSALTLYSLYSDDFGFMSSPIAQDDKRTQSEITAIAMKKTMEFDASYYQTTADAIARRLILSASFESVTV